MRSGVHKLTALASWVVRFVLMMLPKAAVVVAEVAHGEVAVEAVVMEEEVVEAMVAVEAVEVMEVVTVATTIVVAMTKVAVDMDVKAAAVMAMIVLAEVVVVSRFSPYVLAKSN